MGFDRSYFGGSSTALSSLVLSVLNNGKYYSEIHCKSALYPMNSCHYMVLGEYKSCASLLGKGLIGSLVKYLLDKLGYQSGYGGSKSLPSNKRYERK